MKRLEGEVIIARMHRHGRKLVLPAVWAVIVIMFTTYGVLKFSTTWFVVPIGVIGAFAFLMGSLVPWMRWGATRYTLTTQRAIARDRAGHQRAEVFHKHCTSVYLHQSLGQKVRHSGDITGTTPYGDVVRFIDVPDAQRVRDSWQELVYEAMAAQREAQRMLYGYANDVPYGHSHDLPWHNAADGGVAR